MPGSPELRTPRPTNRPR